MSLLMAACEAKYHEAVDLLLQRGAGANITDVDGRTALRSAAQVGINPKPLIVRPAPVDAPGLASTP